MDRQTLLAEIRGARAPLEEALGHLSADQMAERVNGDWTRTDVVAHLAGWEERTLRLFSILRGERDFDPDEPGEVDAFNAWWFERTRGRPADEVVQAEAEAYRGVVGLVESAADADLTDPSRFPFLEGRAFERVVLENTSEHYPDHLEQLRPA
jgi:hypothetical protein